MASILDQDYENGSRLITTKHLNVYVDNKKVNMYDKLNH